MDKIEQYIISACVKNDPSIMELKKDCFVKDTDGKEVMLSHINVYGDWIATHGDFHGARVLDRDPKVGKYTILGKDIYLHDILFAHKFTDGGVALAVSENGEFWTFGGLGKQPTGVYWNLKKPLHEQEEETKVLVAKILGFSVDN